MIAHHLNLTEKQNNSFNPFLLSGTGKALNALNTMFGLSIDRSDSSIEISPAVISHLFEYFSGFSGLLFECPADYPKP